MAKTRSEEPVSLRFLQWSLEPPEPIGGARGGDTQAMGHDLDHACSWPESSLLRLRFSSEAQVTQSVMKGGPAFGNTQST